MSPRPRYRAAVGGGGDDDVMQSFDALLERVDAVPGRVFISVGGPLTALHKLLQAWGVEHSDSRFRV